MRVPKKVPASQAINKSAPTKVLKKKAKKDSEEGKSEEDDGYDPAAIKSLIGKKRAFPFNNTMSQPTNRKVKKLNDDGVSESVEKPAKKAANKPAKLPTVFKLGKWNPDTVLVKPEEELEKSSHKDTLLNNCCTRCNNRNVVRAVLTNNLSLLKKCMNAKETVPSLTSQWAIDTPFLNPVDLIIKS